ncbi:hypothetical protein L6164_013495 [Bauhinia variegata]|uniref:Uncharacterized protein n=1 Tax=Bauhinia variegata TaxID=167791 RepID=A0ACB9NF94_BAUVA|nr:hypothetical protein L6164_013495 [Bauhinia variegata]
MALPLLLVLIGIFSSISGKTDAQSIGICYGQVADNLPPPQEVIDLFKTNGIGRMRIYNPDQATLQALSGSGIELVVGVPDEILRNLADAAAATAWVQTNILNFPDVKFKYIAVGNEIKPNAAAASFVLPAIQNINAAIVSANLQSQIKVSTAIELSLLGPSSPPSAGAFSSSARVYINPIISFLENNSAPLLANVYPYFAHISDPNDISLAYATFTSPSVVVQDGPIGYQNLFDAMLGALYAALEKAGATNLEVVVSESGWPSEGGTAADVGTATTYYHNLINHARVGTPKRPGEALEVYLFAMFDEDQKGPAETEKHFGLFSPSKQPKYQFCSSYKIIVVELANKVGKFNSDKFRGWDSGIAQIHYIEAAQSTIGICYGQVADNLPPPQEVIDLFKTNGIGRMRIYNPDQATLQALSGSGIELVVGVPNEILQTLANSADATAWVQTNILNFSDVKFKYINVGNEINPNDAAAQFVLPAMQNINAAIVSANLQSQIEVSTAIQFSLLGTSFPPSAGAFSPSASAYINPIINFLANNSAPLLANVYPYFAYIGDQNNISLAYATFTSSSVVVQDGPIGYKNIFDAILGALYAALEKAGAPNLEVVVSESGWPSDGGAAADVGTATTYYQNLINHAKVGTPKRPGEALEVYLFAMFDEDQKGAAETEKHFGLFSPSKQPKYQISFN